MEVGYILGRRFVGREDCEARIHQNGRRLEEVSV
jgi:hypothetical protein